jgi:hypothetical protein
MGLSHVHLVHLLLLHHLHLVWHHTGLHLSLHVVAGHLHTIHLILIVLILISCVHFQTYLIMIRK